MLECSNHEISSTIDLQCAGTAHKVSLSWVDRHDASRMAATSWTLNVKVRSPMDKILSGAVQRNLLDRDACGKMANTT
jgi:hypothetical protein